MAPLLRAEKVDGVLHAVQVLDRDRALAATEHPRPGPFSGVPTFVKDNTDVAGMPTNHGSEAFVAVPAKHDAPFTRTLLGMGLVPLGKSRLPEFGFNATTEFMTQEPVRNLDQVIMGVVFALLGLLLFKVGLVTGLDPLGSQVGSKATDAFTPNGGLYGTVLGKVIVLAFAFAVGYGA